MISSPILHRQNPGGVLTFIDPLQIPGNVFFVNSTVTGASDTANDGRDPAHPLATIDAAIGKCTANNNDLIIVGPGHAETVAGAAGIDADVAGISIIGQGLGEKRPVITLSAVASTVAINAGNVALKNLIFKVTADVTIVIDVNKEAALIEDCEIRAGTAKEFVTGIDLTGAAANACDYTTIRRCRILSAVAGASRGIELGEVADLVKIDGCEIWGDYGDAPIHNPTGKILTNLLIQDCLLQNTQTGDHALELVSACTGVLARNLYYTDLTQATGADPGSCFSYECYQCDAIDVSAILTPVVT